MNQNYFNQMMYLLARMVGYFVILIFVGFATNFSVETKQMVTFVVGFIVIVLDLVMHLKNKWNGMALLIASFISVFFLNHDDPFLTITFAMVLTIFFSPFTMIFIPNKQEEKPAAA